MKKKGDPNSGQISTNLPIRTLARLRFAARYMGIPMCDVIELSLDTVNIPKIYDPRIVKDGCKVMFDLHLAAVREHGENQELIEYFRQAGEDDQK
jgi:hypothetical protein